MALKVVINADHSISILEEDAPVDTVISLLQEIRSLIVESKGRELTIMADQQSLLAGMQQIDAETNRIAGVLNDLKNQIAQGMTPEQVTQVQNQLDMQIAKLKGVGADPDNPVPSPTV